MKFRSTFALASLTSILLVYGIARAQTPEPVAYLPAISYDATLTPTVTTGPTPTVARSRTPWRNPAGSFRQLAVIDLAPNEVAVRNDLESTVINLVITRVFYVDGVPQPGELFYTYTGARLAPGEIQRFAFPYSTTGSAQIEAFGVPE